MFTQKCFLFVPLHEMCDFGSDNCYKDMGAGIKQEKNVPGTVTLTCEKYWLLEFCLPVACRESESSPSWNQTQEREHGDR